MNLPLHYGLPGVLEAAGIAFLVGVLVFVLVRWAAMRVGASLGHTLGGASVLAVIAAAGLDCWNLFYLGVVKLESPLYARIALAGIHDADSLGVRASCEVLGALTGVGLGAWWFSPRWREHDATRPEKRADTPDT